MLGGPPLTDMVPSKQTRTARLWIRRVLVRAQEGQLEARCCDTRCRASCVIADINALRNDPDHKERAHESLVESFYKLLGYSPHEDIKYQQGRIDISIKGAQGPVLVTEVKREWGLSRKDEKILKQAFGYALQAGARYVVITNGDYYSVFDRVRGLSFTESFVGEFRITALTSGGVDVIDGLRRERVLASGTV